MRNVKKIISIELDNKSDLKYFMILINVKEIKRINDVVCLDKNLRDISHDTNYYAILLMATTIDKKDQYKWQHSTSPT